MEASGSPFLFPFTLTIVLIRKKDTAGMHSHFPTSFLMNRKYSSTSFSSGEMAFMKVLEESGEGLDFPLRLS